jgi:hypothetical protein
MQQNQLNFLKVKKNKLTRNMHPINSYRQNYFANEVEILCRSLWSSHSKSIFSQHGEHCGAFPQTLVHSFSSYNKSDTGRLMTWNSADKTKLLSSFCWQDHCNTIWKIRKKGTVSGGICLWRINQQGLYFTSQHIDAHYSFNLWLRGFWIQGAMLGGLFHILYYNESLNFFVFGNP